MDTNIDMVQYLTETFYSCVTRYTCSAFMRSYFARHSANIRPIRAYMPVPKRPYLVWVGRSC